MSAIEKLCSSYLSLKSRIVCLNSGMFEHVIIAMDHFIILRECFSYTGRLLPILWGENGTKKTKWMQFSRSCGVL